MAKVIAKPLSLTVRPFQVAHLCFEVGGILGGSFVELGTKVAAFPFGSFYNRIRAANTGKSVDPGRLDFDSHRIDSETITGEFPSGRPPALAALRAETVKAALNKAINARENAFITKYERAAAAGVIAAMRQVLNEKTGRLNRLLSHMRDRTSLLGVAYVAKDKDGGDRTGVVKGPTTTVDIPNSVAIDKKEQVSKTTEVDFRVPALENLLQHERHQINVSDEFISHARQTVGLERMEVVFKNELASIDADVNQLQVAYLNTILLSPIDGIVTGVYKNLGDAVSAGEPVFRVENNAHILIVAKVGCRGPISIGSMLQVKTTLFDIPSSPVTIEAEIVAVRGEDEDDQWEVIAKRKNTDNAGKGPLFPLGYTFDYDNTEVAIFGANEI